VNADHSSERLTDEHIFACTWIVYSTHRIGNTELRPRINAVTYGRTDPARSAYQFYLSGSKAKVK